MASFEATPVSFSCGNGVGEELGASVGAENSFDCEGVGLPSRSKDLSKLKSAKGSIRKKSSIFTKFTQNSEKNELFLIDLIDDLSYNRICVNIIGKYTFPKRRNF